MMMTDMHTDQLLKAARNSKYLSYVDGADWPAVLWVTIERGTKMQDVEIEGSNRNESRPNIKFKELPKPLVIGARNTQFLVRKLGGGQTSKWRGKVVGLYQDPTPKYAGEVVGGIRFCLPDWSHTANSLPPKDAAKELGKAWPPPMPGEQVRAEPIFYRGVSFDGADEWAGQFLADAPPDVIQRYRAAIAAADAADKAQQRADLAAIDAVLEQHARRQV